MSSAWSPGMAAAGASPQAQPSPTTPLETLSTIYSGLNSNKGDAPPMPIPVKLPEIGAPPPPLSSSSSSSRPAPSSRSENRGRSKKLKSDNNGNETTSVPLSGSTLNQADQAPGQAGSSERFKWTWHLHQLFLSSIFEIGLNAASPKKIFDQMRSDPQLAKTLLGDEMAQRLLEETGKGGDIGAHHVKSHLQRYRANVKDSRKAFLQQVSDLMGESKSAAASANHGGGLKPPINPEYHVYPFASDRAFPDQVGMTIEPIAGEGTDSSYYPQMMRQMTMREMIEKQNSKQLALTKNQPGGAAASTGTKPRSMTEDGEWNFDESIFDYLDLDDHSMQPDLMMDVP